MAANPSRITIHMVASLDFFIAKNDGSVSWIETPDHFERGATFDEGDEYVESIDCYVMGSRTYEDALRLGWPYGDTPVVVLTSRELPADRASVTFYCGDLCKLIDDRLNTQYKNIWIVGGAMVAKEFLRSNLVDDMRITIVPIILGDGTPFVDHAGIEQPLHLKDVTAYQNGLVELWYELRKK